MDDARCVNHHRIVATIVERASPQFPRVEVCAQHHELVWLLATANFTHHICRLYRAGDMIRHVETHANALPGREEAGHALRILARYYCLRNRFNLSALRYCVPVEQQIRPRGHPEYSRGARLLRIVDDSGIDFILTSEIFPTGKHLRMNQHDRGLCSGTCIGETRVVTGAHV